MISAWDVDYVSVEAFKVSDWELDLLVLFSPDEDSVKAIGKLHKRVVTIANSLMSWWKI